MPYPQLETLQPATCISGQMRRMNLITANIFRKHLRPFGITDSQLTILFILAKKKALSQKEISKITLLDKSSVHRSLTRLLQQGLISRSNFPLISITEKGMEQVEVIIPAWEKAMAEIKSLLEKEGLSALQTLTTKFFTNL